MWKKDLKLWFLDFGVFEVFKDKYCEIYLRDDSGFV